MFILSKLYKKFGKKGIAIVLIVFAIIAISSISTTTIVSVREEQEYSQYVSDLENEYKTQRDEMLAALDTHLNENKKSEFMVYILDVGQGDCTLVVDGEDVMLIDAGNNEDGKLISDFLQSMDIKEIDYLIGTHPHEDHIGGLDNIIETFDIGVLYMPDVEVDTYTYQEVISAANEHGVKIVHPAVADNWNVGDATCTVLSNSPVENFDDLNEWSIVLHVDTTGYDFLFMSDAQAANERAIMESGLNYRADIFRASHHGSSDANSKVFLETIRPKYSIISVGADNDYGHPHSNAVSILKQYSKFVRETRLFGSMLFKTSGVSKSINVSCNGMED